MFLGFLSAGYAQEKNNFITDCELSGFTKTPRYQETIAYSKALAEASPQVHYTTFGVSPEGRKLPLLIIDKEGGTTPEEIRKNGKAVIFIEACIHAGEPDGKDAGFMFFRDLVIHKKHTELLDRVSFIFIPVFNVDGHENFSALNRINQNGPEELGTRATGQLINLNRDFLKADAPEMKAWLKLFGAWQPELFIDIHVTNGADFQYVMTYATEVYCSFMESNLQKWNLDVFDKTLKQKMKDAGYPIFPYFSFLKPNAPEAGIEMELFDPRYSQGYAAARNRIGLLIENHIYKPYKERVLATYEVLLASAGIIYNERESLQKAIDTAEKNTASAAFRRQPMDFAFKPTYRDSVMVDFLAWERVTVDSDLSGGKWTKHDYTKPRTVRTPLYTSYEPTIRITLPEAYLFMPQWKEAIALLDLHGVKYRRLEESQPVKAETYRYKKATFAKRQSEGRVPVSTEYTTQTEVLTCPQGALLIDMNQPAARMAAWLLEPEAPGSLTYWGFFNSVVQAPGEFWISLPYMEVKGRELLEKEPAIRAEFEARKKNDLAFAKDPQAILEFFMDKVRARAENDDNLHPAWRITDRGQLAGLK